MAKQMNLIPEEQEAPIVKAADAAVEAQKEKEISDAKYNTALGYLSTLMKKSGKTKIRHGGAIFKRIVSPEKEKVTIVKVKDKNGPPVMLPNAEGETAHGKTRARKSK